MWRELAEVSVGKVRFRVACFINELPRPITLDLGELLKDDRHKKAREMARFRLREIGV